MWKERKFIEVGSRMHAVARQGGSSLNRIKSSIIIFASLFSLESLSMETINVKKECYIFCSLNFHGRLWCQGDRELFRRNPSVTWLNSGVTNAHLISTLWQEYNHLAFTYLLPFTCALTVPSLSFLLSLSLYTCPFLPSLYRHFSSFLVSLKPPSLILTGSLGLFQVQT